MVAILLGKLTKPQSFFPPSYQQKQNDTWRGVTVISKCMSYFIFSSRSYETLGNVSFVYEGMGIYKYYYYYTHNDNLADPDKKPPNVFSRNYIKKKNE